MDETTNTTNDFKVIETQEQLDSVIKSRLTRERAKYADYDELKTKVSDYEQKLGKAVEERDGFTAKITELEGTIAEREATIQRMATDSLKSGIAAEYGLPTEMASRLNGSNEDELRADAESLASMLSNRGVAVHAPLKKAETKVEEDGVMAAFRKMNPNIKI